MRERGSYQEGSKRAGGSLWTAVPGLILLTCVVAAYSPLAPWSREGNFTVCWAIEAAFIFASVWLIWKIGRMYASDFAALIPPAVTMLLDVRFYTQGEIEEYLYPFLLLSMLCLMQQIRSGSDRRRMAVIGCSASIAFFLKYSYILIWIVMFVIVLVHMLIQRDRIRDILTMCGYFFLGIAVTAALPLVALIVSKRNGTTEDYGLPLRAQSADVQEVISSLRFLIWTPMGWYLVGFGIFCLIALIAWIVSRQAKMESARVLHMEEIVVWLILMVSIFVAAAVPAAELSGAKLITYACYVFPIAIVSEMLWQYARKFVPAAAAGIFICALALWTVRSGILSGAWKL